MVCASLNANESSTVTANSTRFFCNFEPWLPIRVFFKSVWLSVSMMRLLRSKCLILGIEKFPFS